MDDDYSLICIFIANKPYTNETFFTHFPSPHSNIPLGAKQRL